MRSWMRLDSPAAVRILRKRDLQRVHLWTKTACISTSTSTSPSPLPPLSGSIHQQSVAVSHCLPLLTLALSLAACSQLSLAAHLCQALGQDETIQAKLTTRRRQRSTTTTAPPTCPDTSVAKPPDAVTHRAPPRSPVPPSDPASRVAARR